MPSLLILSLLQIIAANAHQPAINIGARAATDPGLQACSFVDYALSFCNSATPGFSTLNPTYQAPCLCYSFGASTTLWEPNIYDNAIQTCATYASEQNDASLYTELLQNEGFCSSVGNLVTQTAPASATAHTTSSKSNPIITSKAVIVSSASGSAAASTGSVDIFTNPDCSFVGFALSYCNSVSPGFTTFEPSSQAPCLCYSSTSWSPQGFDGPVLTCAEYVSSAAPQSLTDIVGLEGFCSSVGDVYSGAESSLGSVSSSLESGAPGIGVTIGGLTATSTKVQSTILPLGGSKQTTATPAPTITVVPGSTGPATTVPVVLTTRKAAASTLNASGSLGNWGAALLVIGFAAFFL